MRRRLPTSRILAGLGGMLLVAVLVVVLSPKGPARLGILGTRALAITATVAPPAFSTLLTRVLGLGGSEPARASPPFREGGDAPILVVGTRTNPFSQYLVEILRAEGLNALAALDVSDLTATTLRARTVVVLGEMRLDAAQVALLTAWTEAGGTLVAMRPDPGLADLFGLAPASGTLADGYLRVDTAAGPGVGIVAETMQFHGPANLCAVRSATVLATLYTDATTPSRFPAVTSRRVGAHGGVAVAFTYDLGRSVVYTRQGNPAWAGQERDAVPPKRSVDLFFGNAAFDPAPDWVDVDKLAIPQADEQQRLLANVIVAGSLHRQPLPRFWYLPKGWNAAVVMTGDAHGDAGIRQRFDRYRELSAPDCAVDDWECVRATAYLYLGTTFTPAEAERYTGLGFEIGLHVDTNCADWNSASLAFLVGLQLRQFRGAFPGIPVPVTSRTHCVAWSDWSTQPEIEAAHGIRLDTNYYFYPPSWVRGRAALFTGSGFPMRFAARDGRVIDCYQAATQIPDESGLALPQVVDALLDRANGPEGYYGVVTTNMHFDQPSHPGSDAIVASARARGVPVVSARQMLTWLDGRNGSSFEAVRWRGDTLTFTVALGAGARNLRGMLPMRSAVGPLRALTHDGRPLAHSVRIVKGLAYAFFAAEPGNYAATYEGAGAVR